jgi:UDP-glucose 4-epimerase
MTAKVLVTGGAGFIGSHLVEELVAQGASVRVLDNLSTGNLSNLAQVREEIEFLEGDLRDPEVVQRAVKGVRDIYHQAAYVSVPGSVQAPDVCLDINAAGTRQLLQSAVQGGVRRVVLASSSAVYGENQHLPLEEDQPPDLLSPYAASKRVTEIYAELFQRVYGLQVVALRYFNVFGPRQSAESDYAAVIPIFIRRLLKGERPVIYGDGGQTRDFVYVDDVVRANLRAAAAGPLPNQVYNVCSGREINLHDLLEMLDELIPGGQEPDYGPPRAGDIYRSSGDPDRAERELDFEVQVEMIDGLAETIRWMGEKG